MKKVSFLFVLLCSISYAQTVTIGTQVWMTKNLNVATFRNGDSIPQAKTKEEWNKAGANQQPAWCYHDNYPGNGDKYGKLYNWYAVNDSRGLAPVGYHIPSDAEWTNLENFLGLDAGKKMKSKNGWSAWHDDGNGTNTSGFSGLPGGFRASYAVFDKIGSFGYWWSSTNSAIEDRYCPEGDAWLRQLTNKQGGGIQGQPV